MKSIQFLESHASTPIKNRPSIFGCPLDRTSTYRSGSDKAPNAIRQASDSIETYSPYRDRDLMDLKFSDLGDLDLVHKDLEQALKIIESMCINILTQGAKPVALGGEHTVTLPIIRALNQYFDDFLVIHIDAHSDLRQEYDGQELNHSTVIRRVAEIMGPSRLIQLGIRSGTKPEFEWMRSNKTLYEWGKGSERYLLKRLSNKKVYLTLDLDVMDPACLPGTGNPETGGWFFHDLDRLFNIMTSQNIIGADVVELNPVLDSSGASSIMAATIVRELLLII